MAFRSLHNALLEYKDKLTFTDVLSPWLRAHPEEVNWLRSVRERPSTPIPKFSVEDLWRLYAASRAFELLVLQFQSRRADGSDLPGPFISEDEFSHFSQCIGLEVTRPDRYSPFHHEIVGLSSSTDAAKPVQLSSYNWPCLMLGPLLFMRAGVTVCAGSRFMAPEIADRSTLYWANRRRNRPCHDLSYGWGSNSSWRTSFRRDYHLDDRFHFNVDGENDLSKLQAEARDEFGLSPEERMELLANRCFVVNTKDNGDLFPYDDRFSMQTG
jgi:hypothetical protein